MSSLQLLPNWQIILCSCLWSRTFSSVHVWFTLCSNHWSQATPGNREQSKANYNPDWKIVYVPGRNELNLANYMSHQPQTIPKREARMLVWHTLHMLHEMPYLNQWQPKKWRMTPELYVGNPNRPLGRPRDTKLHKIQRTLSMMV